MQMLKNDLINDMADELTYYNSSMDMTEALELARRMYERLSERNVFEHENDLASIDMFNNQIGLI